MDIKIIKTNDRFTKGQEVKVTRDFGKELIKNGIAERIGDSGSLIVKEEAPKIKTSKADIKKTKKNKNLKTAEMMDIISNENNLKK